MKFLEEKKGEQILLYCADEPYNAHKHLLDAQNKTGW